MGEKETTSELATGTKTDEEKEGVKADFPVRQY